MLCWYCCNVGCVSAGTLHTSRLANSDVTRELVMERGLQAQHSDAVWRADPNGTVCTGSKLCPKGAQGDVSLTLIPQYHTQLFREGYVQHTRLHWLQAVPEGRPGRVGVVTVNHGEQQQHCLMRQGPQRRQHAALRRPDTEQAAAA